MTGRTWEEIQADPGFAAQCLVVFGALVESLITSAADPVALKRVITEGHPEGTLPMEIRDVEQGVATVWCFGTRWHVPISSFEPGAEVTVVDSMDLIFTDETHREDGER